MNMKCPSCGEAEMIRDTHDVFYVYKDEEAEIPMVTGDFCPACGDAVFDLDEVTRMDKFIAEFQAKVNASIVDPAFITRVRERLNLDQREAAEIFGGGTNAFSWYEAGKVKPPVVLVKLFKLLERHPELLAEIRPS
jgi:HTH-type transcriptional regulator/antitoxin MqsA